MSKLESAKEYMKEADRLYKDIAMTKNENAFLRSKLAVALTALRYTQNCGENTCYQCSEKITEAIAAIQSGSSEVKDE